MVPDKLTPEVEVLQLREQIEEKDKLISEIKGRLENLYIHGVFNKLLLLSLQLNHESP